MNRPWIYLINPFLTVTDESYRKMKQIGDFTYAAISTAAETATDPAAKTFFTQLQTTLEKPTDNYDHAYVLWLSLQGAQKGQTRSLTDLLDDLRGDKIEAWDIAIQGVYRKDTPPYIALLPRHRAPFQQGKQLQRIAALGALSLAIGDDTKLQNVKAELDAFYDQLVIANNSQKGSKSTKSGSSTELEADRVALAIVLYGVLGLLMNYYQETPDAIASYFLIQVLRSKNQTEWEHDLKPAETRLALTHTFEQGEQITVLDKNNTGLQVALVVSKKDAMPADAPELKNGGEQTFLPEQLGAAGNRFLIVKNMSDTGKGAYHITLL